MNAKGRPVHGRTSVRGTLPVIAAMLVALLGVAALNAAAPGTARAANPTPSASASPSSSASATPKASKSPKPSVTPKPTTKVTPKPTFVAGRHVYDYGNLLSKTSRTRAEALAAHIEAAGAGRVVVYSPVKNEHVTSAMVKEWQIDGLLATTDSGQELKLGDTLKAKLSQEQQELLSLSFSPNPNAESGILSNLARVDTFLAGTHVIDAPGILDQATTDKIEAAAKDLSAKVGGTVYVDIALGADDPAKEAASHSTAMSVRLTKSLVIALSVSDKTIGGAVDEGSGVDIFTFKTTDPWQTNGVLSNRAAANGDVPAAILAAVNAVHSSSINEDIIGTAAPIVGIVLVLTIGSIFAARVFVKRLGSGSAPLKNGVPASAVIQSITDTGMTLSSSDVGPDAPRYKLGLAVDPPGGGIAYNAEATVFVPRVYIPMIIPGARIGVQVDPANPQVVHVDWKRFSPPSMGVPAFAAAAAGAGMAAASPAGELDIAFDASGNPNLNQVAALAGAVSSGAMPTHSGSAAQLLATGTHGTAVVTSAMPLGKTVAQVNPAADPATLNDPVWVFTVEVSLAGQPSFPAVFGHRVPMAKLTAVAPGVKLAVAVNPADPTREVAIDWERSPLSA